VVRQGDMLFLLDSRFFLGEMVQHNASQVKRTSTTLVVTHCEPSVCVVSSVPLIRAFFFKRADYTDKRMERIGMILVAVATIGYCISECIPETTASHTHQDNEVVGFGGPRPTDASTRQPHQCAFPTRSCCDPTRYSLQSIYLLP
jgi:ABC-type nickel/cobalt efflux system permease component RcnA